MSKLRFRPEGFSGSLENHLPGIQNALVRALTKAQMDFTHDTLALARPLLKELAAILVEFAEDLHCGIGIWRSLEQYNRQFFNTPLPLITELSVAPPTDQITPDRLWHLLWILYPQLIPDLLLAPEHVDLLRLADFVAKVLRAHFADVPRDSGVTQFLAAPNDYGWEIKRKLIWLGTKSYLFRVPCQRYIEEQESVFSEIGVIDDFICQQCTEWSGLGALDILASVLNLTPERRTDLLSWSERHNAVFKVLSGNEERIEVLNVINGAKYRVRMDLKQNPFTRGSFVFGSLVPWNFEWYWSGEQRVFEGLDAAGIARMKQHFRTLPAIFYRYSPEELQRARELVREQYAEFVARHGKDWVAFPDGLSMAADWQKAAKEKIASLPAVKRKQVMQKYGLQQPSPKMNIPAELLESRNGIGVYYNPEEGEEIIEDFNEILTGLAKKGEELTSGEMEAIRGWIQSQSISPSFVRRLAEEYGNESIRAAFLLDEHDEDYVLEYLLRKYKGRFYRPRYPTLTMVE